METEHVMAYENTVRESKTREHTASKNQQQRLHPSGTPGNKLQHAEEQGQLEQATHKLETHLSQHHTQANTGGKPVRPDPEEPYQPTEPDEPDVQPEIIDEDDSDSRIAPAPEGFVLKEDER